MRILFLTTVPLIVILSACTADKVSYTLKSENVIVIVVDGARRSETWDDPAHANIPFQYSLRNEGCTYMSFKNNGDTKTVSGHTAILSGHYQTIDNSGLELPERHSLFQYWLKMSKNPSHKAWIISSKDKLEVLANTTETGWQDAYLAKTDCGISGNGSGYRHDSITLARVLEVMGTDQPNLLLVNFREPDFSAHSGNWQLYLKGIAYTDSCIGVIYNFINNHPHYKDRTTVFITNDHGRHSDGVADGFASHGDQCDGCRNISLVVTGPDICNGKKINTVREQTDIPATIAYLMKTKFTSGDGTLMRELFEQ